MRTKLILIFLIVALCFTNFTFVLGADEKVTEEEKVITALNMHPGSVVNKESFIYALMAFVYDDPKMCGNAEELARANGLLDEDENFDPSGTVSYIDGVKYAVKLLGYHFEAEQNGGTDSAYMQVAARLGITKGISASTKRITSKVACTMLYQMLEVAPVVFDFSGKYTIKSETTLIGMHRGIGIVKGLVTADISTSIYGENGTDDGQIAIDEVEYLVKDIDTEGLLGKNIEAYAQYDEDISTILYIAEVERKNEELVIEAENIREISTDFSEIKFETDERVKKAKLSPIIRVIYNGEYYGSYSVDDLKPSVGNIRLLDNNGDSSYDVVFVSNYQTVVVSSTDARKKAIYNDYKFDSCIDVLELDDDYRICKIFKGGKEIEFSEINSSDVLSVLESKGENEKIIKIFVSEHAPLVGKVARENREENTIFLNGAEHRTTDDLYKHIQNKGLVIAIGKEFEFSFDYMGNVVYMTTVLDNSYYVFLKTKVDNDYDSYYMLCMDMNEEWKNIKLSEKVFIDDVRYLAEDAYEIIKNLEPELIKLKFNSAGEIKRISLPVASSTYKKDTFTKSPFSSVLYRKYPNCFNMMWYMENDVRVLVFPDDSSSREKNDYYTVAAAEYFTVEQNYNISVYDVDKFGFTKMIVAKGNNSGATSDYFVITGKSRSILNDEAYTFLEGGMGTYPKISVPVKDDSIAADIECGDVIRVSLNREGVVDTIEKICSLKDFQHSDPGTYYDAKGKTVVATIIDEDIANGRVMLDCSPENDATSIVSLKVNLGVKVVNYEPGADECTHSDMVSLRIGDKIVARLDSGVISSVVRVLD